MLRLKGMSWNTATRRSKSPEGQRFDVCDMANYDVIGRIGSESANARVYEIVTKEGQHYALKVAYKSDEEARLAARLGRISDNFPAVIGWGTCLAELDPDDHVQKSMRQQHFLNVLEATTDQSVTRKRMRKDVNDAFHTEASNAEILEVVSEYGGDVNALRHALLDPLPVTVLASELAWSDLYAVLSGVVDVSEFGSTEAVVASAVADVIGVVLNMLRIGTMHGDLHAGNVLLRRVQGDNKFRAIVHDFGTSRDAIDLEEHKNDLRTFFNAIYASNMGETFEALIETTVEAVNAVETPEEFLATLTAAQAAWRDV